MTSLALTIGKRLRQYRKKANLTQEEVSFRSGLHHTYIGQLERGEKNATIESIAKLSRAFGISLEELFKNIPTADQDESNTADSCYNMILSLSEQEQLVIFDLIKNIISFKDI
jgi:transcriptional regulator with XRE-family HTH domain